MKHFSLPKDGGLIEKDLPKDILHSYEKIPVELYPEPQEASIAIAKEIIGAIKSHKGGKFKLGLTTGTSPVYLYNELVNRYKAGEVSFADVEFFSIDEYYPFSPDERQSRNRRIHDELLSQVDAREENIHIPDGTVSESEISDWCSRYDRAASGLDILVMGVGTQGQIGFNEVGSSDKSRTRTILMSYKTRKIQAKNFNGDINSTPRAAITMGIATMMSAKRIILMAWGEDKTEAVHDVVEGPVTPLCPASFLQRHDNISLYADENAGSNIARVVAPWLVGPCEWTPKFIRKAVVWLCETVHKPILKLTYSDYIENSLSGLLEQAGPYDKINIDVFNDLQHTITGWPGGKPNADDSTRPVSSRPFPKRVVIFSPHPDDDVISMGGTFIRLVQQAGAT